MNWFYLLMEDRHASNKCLLVEQELFLITAGKKKIPPVNQPTNQTPPKTAQPLFSVHAVVDGLSGNAHTSRWPFWKRARLPADGLSPFLTGGGYGEEPRVEKLRRSCE